MQVKLSFLDRKNKIILGSVILGCFVFTFWVLFQFRRIPETKTYELKSEEAKSFLLKLNSKIRADDKEFISACINYPIKIESSFTPDDSPIILQNKQDLFKNYHLIFNDSLRNQLKVFVKNPYQINVKDDGTFHFSVEYVVYLEDEKLDFVDIYVFKKIENEIKLIEITYL